MAVIKPFLSVRPRVELASKIAALPYDVYNREEAKLEVLKEPLSFLRIDRAETQFENEVSTYDFRVYEKARESFVDYIEKEYFIQDNDAAYYIYELTMKGRSQTGIVGCASIDDYNNNVIKKHEKTRAEKEVDRINHVDTLSAQTGPIFLAYPTCEDISRIVGLEKEKLPLYDFIALDGVGHRVWKVTNEESMQGIQERFEGIKSIYIADGHHRAASAVKVGEKRRGENKDYKGSEEFNYFLSVLFPSDELMILPYNRVIKDLNHMTTEEFLYRLSQVFDVTNLGQIPYEPTRKCEYGMFLDEQWYKLEYKEDIMGDSVNRLDVSILQNEVLDKLLGIKDPRVDDRIDFIGGIRGLKELERRVNLDMKVAFSMYPTSINELFEVSNEDKLMPPKSTWFEPKLRSGLFIHEI